MTVRRLAFLLNDPPHAGLRARERLDLVLMSLAYELEVSVVFLGDGVWQLVAGQAPPGSGVRDFAAAYRSLELYGVAGVYAASADLASRGLQAEDLLMPVEPIDSAGLARLLAEQDRLL